MLRVPILHGEHHSGLRLRLLWIMAGPPDDAAEDDNARGENYVVISLTGDATHDPGPEKEPARRVAFAAPSRNACTPDSLWCLRPLLLHIVGADNYLLSSLPSDLHASPVHIFTFRGIQRSVRRHINKHSSLFRDRNSSKIIRCQGTILGRAFNVDAFHKDELDNFIRKCLLPPAT